MTRVRQWVKPMGIALGVAVLLIAGALVAGGFWIINMPGSSFSGPPPAMTEQEIAVRERVREHVRMLAENFGERNARNAEAYYGSSVYIAEQLRDTGCATSMLQPTEIDRYRIRNVEAEIVGTSRPQEILIVGAHYDTIPNSVGANDNASGVAALIEIARMVRQTSTARTVRFLAFYNEEHVSPAGSRLYAELCRARNQNVVGMIALETIGYYTDEPNSQKYPFPFNLFYPTTGNFLAFVGNTDSRVFVHETIGAFRQTTQFPSRGVAAPSFFGDTGRSDHVYFWRNGYPAMMVTDTANFRYPHYHKSTDTPEKIDYDRLARVTAGLARAITSMAGSGGKGETSLAPTVPASLSLTSPSDDSTTRPIPPAPWSGSSSRPADP
jgi:Zn-dependent M28 family amino/carboxypeptidase